jgi:hypothetical protein
MPCAIEVYVTENRGILAHSSGPGSDSALLRLSLSVPGRATPISRCTVTKRTPIFFTFS